MKIESIKEIDHIGYAVRDMGEAKKRFEALGFTFSETQADEFRNVNVCVATSLNGIRVELLSPLETKKSPIDTYLNKIGNTPYHICYLTKNITETISALQSEGFTALGVPLPSVPLGGNVCFLYSNEIGLIELIEYGE